jgi:drug/metabolite transporter (DMT)-like permease
MKFSSLQHHHSIFKIINFFTLLAISAVLIRAAVWQTILKLNSLSKSYLCNAVVPFLLLLASHFLFKENITTFNLLGSLIVFTGLLLLFKSMTANQ